VSNRALVTLSDALRHRRTQVGTRWRRLSVGEQALLVVAHLRKGETYTDLAAGFGVGTTTVFRYITEAIEVPRPSRCWPRSPRLCARPSRPPCGRRS
jgi:Helix-turn-helix of DDE superfamily endonuclease